jgi:glucose/arabinose dehydrogenase
MDLLPDGSWLVTERPGRMRIVGPDGTLSDPISGIPEVDARGQGGLLDVAVRDDFDETRRVWWSFAEPRGEGRLRQRNSGRAANPRQRAGAPRWQGVHRLDPQRADQAEKLVLHRVGQRAHDHQRRVLGDGQDRHHGGEAGILAFSEGRLDARA